MTTIKKKMSGDYGEVIEEGFAQEGEGGFGA